MKLELKIDTFYSDKHYGVMKFKGYKAGNLLFDQYERAMFTNSWEPKGQSVNIDPWFFWKRVGLGRRMRPILPPA